jgi:DeoR family fructose operon transcriptional repressor
MRGEEPAFPPRAHEAVDAKRRIAAEVSRLIADGKTVLLDSATICLEVARLQHGRQVTLVTDTTAPADEVAALEGTGTVVKTA